MKRIARIESTGRQLIGPVIEFAVDGGMHRTVRTGGLRTVDAENGQRIKRI
jgi:hypothetical protein